MKCNYCEAEINKKKGWVEAIKKEETVLNREVDGVTHVFCSPNCMEKGAKKLFTFNTG